MKKTGTLISPFSSTPLLNTLPYLRPKNKLARTRECII